MRNYHDEYSRWLMQSINDKKLHNELSMIRDDEKEIEDRFYTELEFGTAGLRGIIGAGTNRMNKYVVRRASAGLALYLENIDNAKERGVAIAYDSRNYSEEFAKETACTLAAYGINSYLYDSLHSVPQLSFTVRELGCIAGIVITASHNPAEYNGYKVYWEHGGQAGPVQADEILTCIRKIDYFNIAHIDFTEAVNIGKIKLIGTEIDEIYYKKTMSLMLNPELVRERGKDTSIVYTPLHGSGLVPVTEILSRIGIKNLHVVPEQARPDGNFPTVKAPNPEDPNAFTLAFDLADKVGANLILGTDPDSDRLGVAVRTSGGDFHMLTGNQIGCILLEYILSVRAQKNMLPKNGLVVKSLVSTMLADAICNKFNIEIRHVLTGFRFIAEQIDLSETTGNNEFLFGFEESFGFLAGGFTHDKDAICASMLVAEAAVHYAEENKTLYDVLNDIYNTYGYYVEKTKSYTLSGKSGMDKIANAMKGLRLSPPPAFDDEKVFANEDFSKDKHIDCQTMQVTPIGLPKSNVIRYFMPEDAWIVVRPSGTEPKLKLYVGAKGTTQDQANSRLEKLLESADALVSSLLE